MHPPPTSQLAVVNQEIFQKTFRSVNYIGARVPRIATHLLSGPLIEPLRLVGGEFISRPCFTILIYEAVFHGPVRSTCFSTPPSTKLSARDSSLSEEEIAKIDLYRYCSAPRCTNSALFRIILIMLRATSLRFSSDSVSDSYSNSCNVILKQNEFEQCEYSSKYDATRIGERKKKRKAIVIVSLICFPTYLSKSNKILKRFDFSSSRLQNNGLRSRVTEEAEKSVEKHESCFPPRGPSPRGRVDLTEQTRRIGADLFPSRGQREREREREDGGHLAERNGAEIG